MRFLSLLAAILLHTTLFAQETIYEKVDEPATFPYDPNQCESFIDACSEAAMLAYLKTAMRYDAIMGEGVVSVQFVVEKDGSITDPQVTQTLNEAADAEALRLVNSMDQMSKKWRGAWHGSGFVRSYVGVEIEFKNKGAAPISAPTNYPPPNNMSRSERVFKVVDEMPMFPTTPKDCEQHDGSILSPKECAQSALLMFVYGNLRYPAADRSAGIGGMCVVNFTVGTDGSTFDARIVRSVSDAIDEEVYRIMDKMADEIRWIPGKIDGTSVPVSYNLPIKFQPN